MALFMNEVKKLKAGKEDALIEAKAQHLLSALKNRDTLKQVLLETNSCIRRTQKKGRYYYGKHSNQSCDPTSLQFKDESRLCKCLFYHQFNHSKNICCKCNFNDRFSLSGFSIPEYEFPSFYEKPKLGRIDLIIKLDGSECLYATEVKSYAILGEKNNEECLLRMIAEIMTYTLGYEGIFKKAIAFFKGSYQANEYERLLKMRPQSSLIKLLRAADITVFMFEKNNFSSPPQITIVKNPKKDFK